MSISGVTSCQLSFFFFTQLECSHISYLQQQPQGHASVLLVLLGGAAEADGAAAVEDDLAQSQREVSEAVPNLEVINMAGIHRADFNGKVVVHSRNHL